MAINSAFSQQGATPLQFPSSSYLTQGGTPQSKALNSVANGTSSKIQNLPTVSQNNASFMKANPQYGYNGASPALGTNSGLIHPQGQPIKSQTQTNVDGSSTSATYHPPAPPNAYNVNVENLTGQATTPSAGTTAAVNTQQGIATNQGTNAPTGTPAAQLNTATVGLLNQQAAPSPAVQAAIDRVRGAQLTSNDIRNNSAVASDVAVGRGQAFQGVLNAEQTGLTNALSEQGQQITAGNDAGALAGTAQGQQITAANNAGGLSNTQQTNQITAATNAASATHPEQLPYGTQYGTPGDLAANAGGVGAGGALNPLNNVDSIAQQVISGQISPEQAYGMGGNIGNWQGVLNQAIQKAKPGFNTATAQGSFAANQANTTTRGTTPTNAAADVYGKTYGELLDLKNTTQNVDQFGSLLIQSMKDPSGATINPTDVKYANQTLAGIKSQLSSQQQAVFDSTYASLKSRISGLLATGGAEIPTQITSDANKILDGSLPLSSLNAVLQRITTEGNILTSNLQNKLDTAGGVIGAPKSNGADVNTDALRAKYGY